MKKFFLKNLKILLIATSLAVTVLLGILLGVILVYQKGLPQIKNLEDIKPVVMTTLYDDRNTPIKDFAIEKRIIVKGTDIPAVLKNALVAAEDNQFYSHWGINFRGFIRAVGGVLLHKKWGGGSSITQQLARGLFLTPEFSISRKLQEMLLAIQIEKKYTKDQILTFYCNKIFLGGSIYGVEAAARFYFGKSVREINLAEAALIAGIVPNPNGIYAIFKRTENVLKRRNYVLLKMLLLKFIDAKEYQDALAAKLPEKPFDAGSESLADYFTEDTRKYLESKYGDNLLYKGGLRVFTTLNGEMQRWAEDALREGLRAIDKRRGWRRRDKLFNLAENKLNVRKYQLPSWENARIEPGQILEGVVMEVGKSQAAVRIAGFAGEMKADARPVDEPVRCCACSRPATWRCSASWPWTRPKRSWNSAWSRSPTSRARCWPWTTGPARSRPWSGATLFKKASSTAPSRPCARPAPPSSRSSTRRRSSTAFPRPPSSRTSPIHISTNRSEQLWEPHNHKGDFLGP